MKTIENCWELLASSLICEDKVAAGYLDLVECINIRVKLEIHDSFENKEAIGKSEVADDNGIELPVLGMAVTLTETAGCWYQTEKAGRMR